MASFFDVMHEPPVDFSKGEFYPWPNRFSIETSAYCNRRCSFCPISGFGGDIPRPNQKLMSEELFTSICDQLREHQFDGCIQLFLLNEPTLDKRLFSSDDSSWAMRLRRACPDCTIYVSTNGDTITRGPRDQIIAMVDRITDIFDSGVNVINLNIYDLGDAGIKQKELYESIDSTGRAHDLWCRTDHKYRRHNSRGRFLCISDMRSDRPENAHSFDSFHSKGHAASAPQTHCARPHRHLVIQYDGRVPLCCAIDQTQDDAVFIGDLNHQTIDQVWNSEIMFRYRAHLQDKRRDLPNCNSCDHKMSYSHVVRRVTGVTL